MNVYFGEVWKSCPNSLWVIVIKVLIYCSREVILYYYFWGAFTFQLETFAVSSTSGAKKPPLLGDLGLQQMSDPRCRAQWNRLCSLLSSAGEGSSLLQGFWISTWLAYIYKYVWVYMYLYVYECAYVYTHTHTHTHTHKSTVTCDRSTKCSTVCFELWGVSSKVSGNIDKWLEVSLCKKIVYSHWNPIKE